MESPYFSWNIKTLQNLTKSCRSNTYILSQLYFSSEIIFINVSWNFALFYQLEIILFLSKITHSK